MLTIKTEGFIISFSKKVSTDNILVLHKEIMLIESPPLRYLVFQFRFMSQQKVLK